MKSSRFAPWVIPFLAVVFTLSPCHLVAASAAEIDADEAALKAAGIPTDGPGLAAYFKKRTATVYDEASIRQLVRQLGDEVFRKRDAASRQLMMIGPRARPYLQAALKDSDPEIIRRAQSCLERIERGMSLSSLSAAVRVLARRGSAENINAAAVLLAYLPSAEDVSVAENIHQSLPILAERSGKADPILLEALTDQSPVKRAAAGAALARLRLPDVLLKVRKLLNDPDPNVRVRVGLALAARGEKEAVPALIGTIDEVPLASNGLVLELLDRLADGAPPPGMPVADQAARRKCRRAWESWWKEHREKIEPARLEQASRGLGFTLIVLLDLNTIEWLDRAKNVRWKITNAQMPLDAQLLSDKERVLLAEYDAKRVSERNFKGEIVWKHPVDKPLMAQRLANGNTFIACRDRLLEIDKDGNEVLRYRHPAGGVFMRATKLRDGNIVCIVQLGGTQVRYIRLAPLGKRFREIGHWDAQVRTFGGRVEMLPDGHVLIPEMDNNRVVEYDGDGHNVWEVTLDQPIAAVRLPNGNTLVTLMRENRAVEVDRTGKEVWHFKADTRVTRAFRR